MVKDLYKDYTDKSKRFSDLFFPGVKLKRKNSDVVWTIVGIEETIFNKIAIVKSQGGYKRRIHPGQYSQFDVIFIPPAYKVLFGEEDNKEE